MELPQTVLKTWRLEINDDPHVPVNDWRSIFEFTTSELPSVEELKDELNHLNRPIQLRIIRNAAQ